MFKYLKQYDIRDLQDMFRNSGTPHHQTTISMAAKTVVIAGATSGVELAAAREIARVGGHVILLMDVLYGIDNPFFKALRSIVGQHFFRGTPAFFAMSYFSVYLEGRLRSDEEGRWDKWKVVGVL